ncbi:AcrR family transcriptional regulator [Paenarthrobacter nitroguajacolicus]|uniref:TetR/AcrR family transcriptional regulator n=1 Tax=Paenarthrobacter nitroguajacolicus TaxID=211146 RepID=UPI0028670002|nr:helix-turn-helix domain-containing protein [Paenarthrobacter nitroguajacolicus]MDR6986975.1 AcrR family transcriptional regulator [Paenarthrobacter nitroguajacolicus]
MTTTGPGRPRKQQAVRPGATARDEILDAAAELFTSQGFANTSTRAIADAVGIRQSSLYHHFSTKDEILGELLGGTVSTSLHFARAIHQHSANAASAAARLHAVVLFDGLQLCTSRWNLGVLYHLPEARAEVFQPFIAARQELRSIYGDLGRELMAVSDADPGLGDTAFRLVESLINLRADGLIATDSASTTADTVMILAGLRQKIQAVRDASSELISRYGEANRRGEASEPALAAESA